MIAFRRYRDIEDTPGPTFFQVCVPSLWRANNFFGLGNAESGSIEGATSLDYILFASIFSIETVRPLHRPHPHGQTNWALTRP